MNLNKSIATKNLSHFIPDENYFFLLKFLTKENIYFINSPVGLWAIKRNLLLAFIVFKILIQLSANLMFYMHKYH